MKRPALQDDALLADIAAARGEGDALHLWWLGQSGFLIQWRDRHLLLDPYLSDSLTTKYAATDKPHIRMTERVVDPSRLDFIDVVTSSHAHTDHLDPETLLPLMRVNPQFAIIVPEANRLIAAERLQMDSGRLIGLDDGSSATIADFEIHAVPSAHEQLEQDDAGHHKYLGYVVCVGPWTLYHSGDTLLYEGMVERLRPWKVDVALLPINGRAPERRVAGNLDGREAAWLGKEIGARCVIPCHYDMFTFNTASPDAFRRAAEELGVAAVVLEQGQRWSATRFPG